LEGLLTIHQVYLWSGKKTATKPVLPDMFAANVMPETVLPLCFQSKTPPSEVANGDLPNWKWKAINSILGRKQPKPIINNLKLENEDIVGPEKVSECFNDHFTRVGAKIADSVESGSSYFTGYLTDVSNDCTFKFNCVDPQTVFDMLHSISTSKATGIDQIPCRQDSETCCSCHYTIHNHAI
jgi:hypothetical protein